jgi:hypothetical protein
MELSFESLETPALTKAQLADLLFEQIGLNKRESKDMIDAFFDLIAQSLGMAPMSRFQVSVIFKSVPKRRVQDAILAPVSPFRFKPGGP